MLEILADDLSKVEHALLGLTDDIATDSPTIRSFILNYLSKKEGVIRARAATQLLCAGLGKPDPDAKVALAVSSELTYTANKIHKEIYYLDDYALDSGAAHLRILVGDYLFSLSSAYVASSSNLSAMRISIDMLAKISEASLDIALENQYHRLSSGYRFSEYVASIERRAASLFQASAEIGAVLADLSPVVRNQLAGYGLRLGVLQHLACNQNLLSSARPGERLQVETAEMALVFWNEYCASADGPAAFPDLYQPDDPARMLFQAAGQTLPFRGQINELIEQKKKRYAEAAQSSIPASAAGEWKQGLAELVEIAYQGQVN